MTEPFQIAFALLGIVGLSGIAAALRSSERLTRRHRFLRLREGEPFDIVLPTSERVEGGIGIKYIRSTTSLGNLRGATMIAQMADGPGRRRPVAITVSEELESRLAGDLIILGLPKKNAVSALVIDHLRRQHPQCGLEIEESDDDGCAIALGDFRERFELIPQLANGVPCRDLALIMLWVNPLIQVKRRLILCAGFTAYGTAAAADYLLSEVMTRRYDALRAAERATLPPLRSLSRWPCFAMVIEALLINDQVVQTKELAFVALPDPGPPPWTARSAAGIGPLHPPRPPTPPSLRV